MFSRYFKILQGAENTTIPPSKRSKYQALYEEALKNFTMIHFFYKELGIVRYSRDELYGKVEVKPIYILPILIHYYVILSAGIMDVIGKQVLFTRSKL